MFWGRQLVPLLEKKESSITFKVQYKILSAVPVAQLTKLELEL